MSKGNRLLITLSHFGTLLVTSVVAFGVFRSTAHLLDWTSDLVTEPKVTRVLHLVVDSDQYVFLAFFLIMFAFQAVEILMLFTEPLQKLFSRKGNGTSAKSEKGA